MRRLLSSPKRRRRLAWAVVVLVAAGTATLIGFLYPNTGQRQSFEPGTPKIVHQEPASTPIRASDRRASEKTLDEFVLSAVLRRHMAVAYDLVGPDLKGGLGRAEWISGDNPVVPFPARDFALARSKLEYSYGSVVRYDVAMFARSNSTTRSEMFLAELHAIGTGVSRHWLVSYWEPAGGGIGTSSGGGGSPSSLDLSKVTDSGRSPLSIAWVLAPLSVLSLIVLVPAGLGVRGWVRNRRADREYAKTLPPLRPPS